MINLFQNDRLWNEIRSDVIELVDREHSTGMAQNSNLVRLLESRLAEFYNRQYCVTFASCTDALVGACIALQLPKHSSVGVSNYTFTATAHAVARAGYTPVPVDVTENYTIDVDKIPAVDAVIAVDVFGNMSNWDQLQLLGIPVINDAAQSLESHNGAMWSATYGDISCISFSPSKTVSSWGSGGALLTDDADIAAQARLLRLHGKPNNATPSVHPGMNSMISSFEAACVWAGLDRSESWQKRRREIANQIINNSKYSCAIDDIPIHTLHKLVFQSEDRANVMQHLKDQGVASAVHYGLTINDESLYNTGNDFSVSNRLKATSFTVPNQQSLTDEEVEQIAKALQ